MGDDLILAKCQSEERPPLGRAAARQMAHILGNDGATYRNLSLNEYCVPYLLHGRWNRRNQKHLTTLASIGCHGKPGDGVLRPPPQRDLVSTRDYDERVVATRRT
jgi:hypothetical protein